MNDIIISIDIETTGVRSCHNSMISLGAVAFQHYKEIASFYQNIEERPGSYRNPETMKWWDDFPEKWEQTKVNRKKPVNAMRLFYNWCQGLGEVPKVLAGNPVQFDTEFISVYLQRYLNKGLADIFVRNRALDIRTALMIYFGVEYSEANRSYIPEEWTQNLTVTHNAEEDARQQGVVLMNLLQQNNRRFIR